MSQREQLRHRLERSRGASLRSYLEAGGGALFVLGENSRVPADVADLLPARITGPVDRRPPGRFGYLDYSHPVLEPFAGPDGGDFSRARFYRYRGLEPAEGSNTG